MSRHQVCVGKTTYTIEDREEGGSPAYVKLSRFKPPAGSNSAEHAEFFVPTSLVIEYVVARLAPRLRRMLSELLLEDNDHG